MTSNVASSNASLLRVPAEWGQQAAVWLTWPHNRETWPGRFDAIPNVFAEWTRLIAESTPVRVLASNENILRAEKLIGQNANVTIIDIPTNDSWIRDYGPTFVRDLVSGKMTMLLQEKCVTGLV
jgi:agmatine deiminase